jgi:hypothetical protein
MSLLPEPMWQSLKDAARLAVQHGNRPGDVNIAKWAETYGRCSEETVMRAFEIALTGHSLTPFNYEEVDK